MRQQVQTLQKALFVAQMVALSVTTYFPAMHADATAWLNWLMYGLAFLGCSDRFWLRPLDQLTQDPAGYLTSFSMRWSACGDLLMIAALIWFFGFDQRLLPRLVLTAPYVFICLWTVINARHLKHYAQSLLFPRPASTH
ncbi:hypothetical protein [Lacticaseibacillus absianus]|uniref:hypothetical protein n=1 Tax=Lacticaseibacillus absianus TaxID=2729623 RepID=UPI0015C8436D|nr:hypothetical protein [Lacticaseibacillus absianus]